MEYRNCCMIRVPAVGLIVCSAIRSPTRHPCRVTASRLSKFGYFCLHNKKTGKACQMGGGGRSGDGKGGGKRPQQHAKQKGGGSPQHGPHPPGNKGISPTPPGGAQEHAQLRWHSESQFNWRSPIYSPLPPTLLASCARQGRDVDRELAVASRR